MAPSAAAPHPLALPTAFSPHAIDAATELSSILAQLKSATVSSAGSQTNPTTSQNGASQTQQPTANSSQPSSNPANPQIPGVENIGDLPLRNVAIGADTIKHKLQRARLLMRQLPDMDRTITEQEDEMAYLEKKIAQQQKALEALKTVQLKPTGMGI